VLKVSAKSFSEWSGTKSEESSLIVHVHEPSVPDMETVRFVDDVEVERFDFPFGERLDAGDLDCLGRLKSFVLPLDDAMIYP